MKQQRDALSLQPGDEIEIDGNWWIVTDHKITVGAPAPIEIQLVWRDRESRDREFISAILTNPTHIFNCEPYCC